MITPSPKKFEVWGGHGGGGGSPGYMTSEEQEAALLKCPASFLASASSPSELWGGYGVGGGSPSYKTSVEQEQVLLYSLPPSSHGVQYIVKQSDGLNLEDSDTDGDEPSAMLALEVSAGPDPVEMQLRRLQCAAASSKKTEKDVGVSMVSTAVPSSPNASIGSGRGPVQPISAVQPQGNGAGRIGSSSTEPSATKSL